MGYCQQVFVFYGLFQNSQSLASLGVVGGFLALLASSGSGQFVDFIMPLLILALLLSYYKPLRI